MLTLDLVRASVRKGILVPRYIRPDDPVLIELAEELIELFRLHEGRPYGELKDAAMEMLGDGPDAQLGRGLFKLLEDRSTIEMEEGLVPSDIRRQVFELAARHMPVSRQHSSDLQVELPGLEPGRVADRHAGVELELRPPRAAALEQQEVFGSEHLHRHRVSRWEILAQVGALHDTSPEAIDAALYADLPEARIVQETRLPEPGWLLYRYNLALAQAILLRAGEVRITLRGGTPARFRQLFRWVKFHRLMHVLSRQTDGSYQLKLDGPLSLFRLSQKYGLQFAAFLPALVLWDDWSLETEVEWGVRRERRLFQLSSKTGLRSHYPDKGVWESREEQWLVQRFATIKTEWQLERCDRLLELGGQAVIAPEFVLRHPDGRHAYLEIVGFWRKSYLERRLALYREHGPGNLILAVSKQLRGSIEDLEGFEGQVYVFREVLVPRDLVALAEQVGKFELEGEEEPAPRRRKTATRNK